MTVNDWQELALWEDTRVQHHDGRVAICFGIGATLYFHDGHTEEKRRDCLECFNEYTKLSDGLLRWDP